MPEEQWEREYVEGDSSILEWREEGKTLLLRDIATNKDVVLRIDSAQVFEMVRKVMERHGAGQC